MTTLKIEAKSEDAVKYGIKVSLTCGGKNYSFFNTKKDGSFTKAWEQYKKYGFNIGDTVNAEVKEEQKSYEGKSYTQRTILYFQEENLGDTTSPVATFNKVPPKQENAYNGQISPVNGSLADLWDIVRGLAEEVRDIKAKNADLDF